MLRIARQPRLRPRWRSVAAPYHMPAPVAGASTQLAWRPYSSSSSRSTLDDQLPNLPNLTISIVGRPNTGKSTLFNRLTRSKMAIVSNVPGTTRDRREGLGHIAGLPLNLIDTGGLDDRGAVSLSIQAQVEAAFATTDVVLFILDARQGVTALDEHFAQWLRRRLGPGDKGQGGKGGQGGNRGAEEADGAEPTKTTVAIIRSCAFQSHRNACPLEHAHKGDKGSKKSTFCGDRGLMVTRRHIHGAINLGTFLTQSVHNLTDHW
jgi:hypothetical protein